MKQVYYGEMNLPVRSIVLTGALIAGLTLIQQTSQAQQGAPQAHENGTSAPDIAVTPERQSPENNAKPESRDSTQKAPPGCRYDQQKLELLV